LPVLAVGLVALSGCGPARLEETKTLAADPAESPYLELPAQPVPQTIKVEYDSSACEVDIGLYKASEVREGNEGHADVKKAMKGESGKKSGSFSVDVPEKTATKLIINSAKVKTNVKVHLTNR
jgi:hypothetical protein